MTLSPWHAPLISFVSTGLGAFILLFGRGRPGPRATTLFTGLAAGVMLGAAILSLMLPGIEIYGREGDVGRGASLVLVVALLLGGAVVMELVHDVVPHDHLWKDSEGPRAERQKRGIRRSWLILFAMALHNVPEGLALGIGLASGDAAAGWPLAVGIAAQNVPEAAMVCLAIVGTGGGVGFALLATVVTGLVEAAAAALGVLGLGVFVTVLPAALILCAGAMLYVVSQEMIPESHSHGQERLATFSLMSGFAAMTALTLYLG